MDIEKEYERLSQKDVYFFSRPLQIGPFILVFARDIDGNVFSLRQVINPDSEYSLVNF